MDTVQRFYFPKRKTGRQLLPVRLIRRLYAAVGARSHPESLARSYAANLAHRLPLIYAVLIVDVLVLAARFMHRAPALLTIVLPLIFCIFAAWRAFYWLPRFVTRRSAAVIRQDLVRMTFFGGYTALFVVGWTLLLYPFGDQAQQSLIQYVTAITCYTAILSLAQSPRTATNIAVAAMVPSTLFHIFQDHPNAVAVAIVQLIVTVLLLAVTTGYHRDFVKLELSRQLIARRERESARLAEANRHDATVDPLTGALNRRAFLGRLEQEVAEPSAAPIWLALLDLDGFKLVNDTYGHAAGDTVLRVVSQRIGALDGVVAFGRLGGDEFAILLDGKLDRDQACTRLQGLSHSLREPISHEGLSLALGASLGLRRAESPTVAECLERCDAALYKAKEKKDGVVVVFSADDEIALTHRSAVTRRFNDCPLEERLRLVYQPIVDTELGRVTGYEAFARWSPDGETWLGPNHFLSLAQATGRTGELTRLVVERALAEAGRATCDLSINLSPRDVLRDGAAEEIAAIVYSAGASPERLVLEITERALQTDLRRATRQLGRFRDKGFRIALDDFGNGAASLSHVRNLPLDRLKIDRGLACGLVEDPGARAIAGTIVGLAWQLGLECTIEGIEDDRQVEMSHALGLRLMQGFHFGHPRPASEIPEFLYEAA